MGNMGTLAMRLGELERSRALHAEAYQLFDSRTAGVVKVVLEP